MVQLVRLVHNDHYLAAFDIYTVEVHEVSSQFYARIRNKHRGSCVLEIHEDIGAKS